MVLQNLMIQFDRRILEALRLVHLTFLKFKDININADGSHKEVETVSIQKIDLLLIHDHNNLLKCFPLIYNDFFYVNFMLGSILWQFIALGEIFSLGRLLLGNIHVHRFSIGHEQISVLFCGEIFDYLVQIFIELGLFFRLVYECLIFWEFFVQNYLVKLIFVYDVFDFLLELCICKAINGLLLLINL